MYLYIYTYAQQDAYRSSDYDPDVTDFIQLIRLYRMLKINLHIYIFIHIYIYPCTHIYTYIYRYISIYMHAHIHICEFI